VIWQKEIITLSDNQLFHISEIVASCTQYFDRYSLLDSHDYPKNSHTNGSNCYRLLAGFGKQFEVTPIENSLIEFQQFLDFHKANWYFGHLNYDLKNNIECRLTSNHDDIIGFPELSFFIPEIVIAVQNDVVNLWFTDKTKATAENIKLHISTIILTQAESAEIISNKSNFITPNKQEYLKAIESIKYHLHLGDIYELNYCVAFVANNISISPLKIWNELSLTSPAPLSCFYKLNDCLLMSASPERFIRKENKKIISQPIKGTARRSIDKKKDSELKEDLISNEKERAENVMIVDLVRNDLSHIAKKGSVTVEELFGIYEFPQVYQLISTISAEIKNEMSFTGILKALFPMGSMTGAPKISAMQFIEQFETFKRGLFSGAIGYINPENDFDFNVVIRSIFYNEKTKTVMIPAGSAITDKSDPEGEYEECLLKAKALLERIRN